MSNQYPQFFKNMYGVKINKVMNLPLYPLPSLNNIQKEMDKSIIRLGNVKTSLSVILKGKTISKNLKGLEKHN